MNKWIKCCFPKSKDDLVIQDKIIEYKDDDESLFQSKINTNNNERNNHPPKICLKDNDPLKATTNNNNNNKINDNQTDSFTKKTEGGMKDKSFEENNNKSKLNQSHQEHFLELVNSSIEITNEEINKAPIITLTEEEGNIFNGKQIKINAGGLIGGRNFKDGVSIFGFDHSVIDGDSSKAGISSSSQNDFNLNYSSHNFISKDYPYIFVIYYDREKKAYFMRAYSGKGSENRSLFVKLTNTYDLPLKQKEIIFCGSVLFQITPSIDYKSIEILSLTKKDNQSTLCQTFDEVNTKEVTIGRNSICTFSFPKDKTFSRIQTTFYYDEEKKYWIIMDGNRMKSSTNGTWAFVIHSLPIQDQMIVEILTSKVKVSLSN